jgi:hypothetical protein
MIFWDLGIGQGYFKNGLMALWFKWFDGSMV